MKITSSNTVEKTSSANTVNTENNTENNTNTTNTGGNASAATGVTTASQRKRGSRTKGAIVALSAMVCLTGLATHFETATAAGNSATSFISGRAKPRVKKSPTQKRKPAKTATPAKPKPKALPVQVQQQKELKRQQQQNEQALRDQEFAVDNVDGCEYDESQDEYWCDEENSGDQPSSPDEAISTEGTYKISGDAVDTRGANAATAKTVESAWKRFATLIPKEQRSMISAFSLIDESITDYDGQVEEIDPRNHRWELRLKAGDDTDDFVIAHEFGHLLTLSQRQIDASVSEQNCQLFRFEEGCPRADAFTGQFIQRFWTTELVRQSERNSGKLFKRHPDWFVRDYAATNPGEDLADTFAEFVANPKQPTGNRIVDQKINMFYADPDMVWLRNQIRINGNF